MYRESNKDFEKMSIILSMKTVAYSVWAYYSTTHNYNTSEYIFYQKQNNPLKLTCGDIFSEWVPTTITGVVTSVKLSIDFNQNV